MEALPRTERQLEKVMKTILAKNLPNGKDEEYAKDAESLSMAPSSSIVMVRFSERVVVFGVGVAVLVCWCAGVAVLVSRCWCRGAGVAVLVLVLVLVLVSLVGFVESVPTPREV
jgi:hypothetical protein